MDQNPGSGGNDAGIVTQEPAQQKKAGKKYLWIWIASASAALAVLALVLALAVFPAGSGGSGGVNPEPLIYRDGLDVYLAVGAKGIKLDDADISKGDLNATLTHGNDTLYYLSNVDSSSGEGDLMRIGLGNANAKPESAAQGVYSARVSSDGERILYLTGVEKGAGAYDFYSDKYEEAGELNICSPGGDPVIIGDSVSDMYYGFSPNGDCAFYVVRSNGKRTLMVYSGNEAKEAYTFSPAENIDSVYADDSGRALFTTYSNSKYSLYLYEGGSAKLVSKDALTTFVFGDANDFLYYSMQGVMGYYSQGDETLISEDGHGYVQFPAIEGVFTHFRFPGLFYKRYPHGVPDKHFLYVEGKGDNYMVYEVSLPGKKVEIGKCDKCGVLDRSYRIDSGFRNVAREFENTLYLDKKTDGGWEDVKVCRFPSGFEFDDSGEYLYYIEGVRSGDLCRISTATGETETLMKDTVRSFLLWEGSCYAVNDAGEAYLVKNANDSQKLKDDVRGLYPGNGGVYAIGREIFFLSGGKSEHVASVGMIPYSGEISGLD